MVEYYDVMCFIMLYHFCSFRLQYVFFPNCAREELQGGGVASKSVRHVSVILTDQQICKRWRSLWVCCHADSVLSLLPLAIQSLCQQCACTSVRHTLSRSVSTDMQWKQPSKTYSISFLSLNYVVLWFSWICWCDAVDVCKLEISAKRSSE